MALVGFAIEDRAKQVRLDLDAERPNEATILRCLEGGQFYEPDIARIFLRVLRPGDTVIDVGGNAGFFTILAATLVGPTGQVATFEPDPGNVARLRQNVAVNGFAQVSIIDRPAVALPGTVSFYLNDDDSGGSALWDPGELPGNARSRETPRVLTLPGTTIDAEVARLELGAVRLLKIDTEGAEHAVLRGAAQLLAGAAVPFVICELHEFGLARLGSSQMALRGFMARLGYDTFMLYADGSLPRLVPPGTHIRTSHYYNMLFSRLDMVGEAWPDYLHQPMTP
jgi:FkbM family methyltransferase